MLTGLPRFFLFHASLVAALAILGDSESSELPNWRYDVELSKSIFRGVLKDNPLATRCADILDHILPIDAAGISKAVTLGQFDASAMDPSFWSNDLANMVGSFGWLDAQQLEGLQ